MAGTRRKILLVEPPFNRLFKPTYSLDRFPLALGYLAGVVLRDTAWDAAAYNADFADTSEPVSVRYLAGEGFSNYKRHLDDPSAAIWQDVRATIERCAPDVVGISTKGQTFASARRVAAIAKALNSGITVIAGGPHPSLAGDSVMGCADIDIAVRGEGERTLVELLGALDSGKDLADIPGLLFRNGDHLADTGPRELIADVDSLPFPAACADAALVGRERYPLPAFRYVFAARGCPHRCFFCGSHGVWTRRVRRRSPENIVAELRALRQRGLRNVHFDDDTFGVTPAHTMELCEAIRRGCPGLHWSCEINVKLARPEVVAAMKRSGCRSVQLGIESGSDEMLAAIGKNITADEALQACREIKRAGMELVAFFMVGFPQETEGTLAETVALIEQAPADVVVYSIFTPYEGTAAWKYCVDRGLIAPGMDPSLHYHQSPLNCFCEHLAPARFREIVTELEQVIDRRNARARRRRLFSLQALGRARELGVRGALDKLLGVLRAR